MAGLRRARWVLAQFGRKPGAERTLAMLLTGHDLPVAIAGAALGIPAALVLAVIDPPLWLSMTYLIVMDLVVGGVIVRGHHRA